MNKLSVCLVMVLTPIMSASVCADSIVLVDQKYAVSDVNAKRSKSATSTKSLYSSSHPVHLYLDEQVVAPLPSSGTYARQSECNYTVDLGLDDSIKVSAGSDKCTNKFVRKAAPPYQPADLYIEGAVVSYTNKKEDTIGLYQCFYPSLCSVEGYGPDKDLAWVQLSKRYISSEENSACQNEDTYNIAFTDYKHAAYLIELKEHLPFKTTLAAKTTRSGYLHLYVDNAELNLQPKTIRGYDCNYSVTLNADNSIYLHSAGDGCFKGYARKASGLFNRSVTYKRGDTVIEKDLKTSEYKYYQCFVPALCSEVGYAPSELNSSYAWALVYRNLYPPRRQGESLGDINILHLKAKIPAYPSP